MSQTKWAIQKEELPKGTRLSACHVRQPIKITYCQSNILRYSGRRKQLWEDYLCRNLISFTQSQISASLLQTVRVLGFGWHLAQSLEEPQRLGETQTRSERTNELSRFPTHKKCSHSNCIKISLYVRVVELHDWLLKDGDFYSNTYMILLLNDK